MSSKVYARINPVIIKWARLSIGLSIEDFASKIKKKVQFVEDLENGAIRPTIPELMKIAEKLKRPIYVFYLEKPPSGYPKIKDFRRLPGNIIKDTTELLILERVIQNKREEILYLAKEAGIRLPTIQKIDIIDDYQSIAKKIINLLQLDEKTIRKYKTDRDAFKERRFKVEKLGIFVYCTAEINIEELRGFSVFFDELPIIIINNKDSSNGKSFTLIHELAHLLIRRDGIWDSSDDFVEVLCNNIANEVLVPTNEFINNDYIKNFTSNTDIDNTVTQVANQFNVSKQVVLRKLLNIDLINSTIFKSKYEEYNEEYKSFKEQQKGKKFLVRQEYKIMNRFGFLFSKIVMESLSKNIINHHQFSEYYNMSLKYVEPIIKNYKDLEFNV